MIDKSNVAWVRKCQECGYEQFDHQPSVGMSDAYAMRKCKRCKSMALDYGRRKQITEGDEQ